MGEETRVKRGSMRIVESLGDECISNKGIPIQFIALPTMQEIGTNFTSI